MGLKLCLLFLFAAAVLSQDCDPASQVAFQVPATFDDINPFLSLAPPATCEGFAPEDLLACSQDINVKEGCCTKECKNKLKQVDRACFGDITDVACKEGAASLIPYMSTLVARCVEGEPLPLSCPSSAARVELTQEACTEDRVEADEPIDISALLPLASLVPPQSCADFAVTELLTCQAEINIVEGCCEEACQDVFEPVSRECMEDIGYLICISDSSDVFSLLNRVAQRCHSDPSNLTCKELIARGPPKEAPAPEINDTELVGDMPDDDEVLSDAPAPTAMADTDEAEEEETFFGVSDPIVAIPTAEEETFFGVQDAPTDAALDSSSSSCADTDEDFDVNDIVDVLSNVDPEKCPDFDADTFACQTDIARIGDGDCCEPTCRTFMEDLSDECIEEVLRVACSQTDIDTHTIFERTAKRCIGDYEPRSCDDILEQNGDENGANKLTIIGSVAGGLLLVAMLLI